MKTNILSKLRLIILSGVIFYSCEKWIDPDLNIDPNQASEVSMNTLLPSIEGHLAYVLAGGNTIIGYQAIWLQQLDGYSTSIIGPY